MPLTAETILSQPAQVYAAGNRPLAQRKSFTWLQTAALSAMVGLAGLMGSAHAHEGHDLTPTAVTASAAAATQAIPAQFASNTLQDQATRGSLTWMDAQGQVDGMKLLGQWEAGGLTPMQAFELINVLTWTQSPVVARTQQALDSAAQLSQVTQDIGAIQTARNAEFFLRRNNCEVLAERGLLPMAEAINIRSGQGKSWEDVRGYWNALTQQRRSDAVAPFAHADAASMQAARQSLLQATEVAGLASLRIPLATWGNAQALERLADRVEAANTQLQQITGMTGQVLGLNNRASLTATSPSDDAFAYLSKGGNMALAGFWEDIPHEWLHALDSTLRTAPVNEQVLGGYSLTQQLQEGGARNGLEQSWQGLGQALDSNSTHSGGQWLHKRTEHLQQLKTGTADDTARAIYLGAPSEMVAYAWGAYVQSQLQPDSVFADTKTASRPAYDGVVGPTLLEASQAQGTWKQLFSAVDGQWWKTAQGQAITPESAPQLPDMQGWRAARQVPNKPTQTTRMGM